MVHSGIPEHGHDLALAWLSLVLIFIGPKYVHLSLSVYVCVPGTVLVCSVAGGLGHLIYILNTSKLLELQSGDESGRVTVSLTFISILFSTA